MRQYYVYILRCSDGSYYTGMTNNLDRRVEEHASGLNQDCYTFEGRPVELVHSIVFFDVRDAIDCETMIKAWSHKKKEALVRGDRRGLKLLSRKKFSEKFKMQCIKAIAHQRFFVKLQFRALLGKGASTRNDNYS